ncbi:19606_t:CDS:1, partial [Racocetra persica]
QPPRPQNTAIHTNLSYDNLTAGQKYESLTEGTNPFVSTPETTNQEALPFPAFILSGSPFQ